MADIGKLKVPSVSEFVADATNRNFPHVPKVNTRTDHSLSINVAGKSIGRIQDWIPQQSRNIETIYEVNSAGCGNVFEQVPGIMTGLTINIVRFDLYNKKMEQVWGPDFDITMLCDQINPIRVNEKWSNADGTMEIWTYMGCWFSSLGRAHSAVGDRITRVNATLVYTKKYKVSAIKAEITDAVEGFVRNL